MGVAVVAQWKWTRLVSKRMWVRSLASRPVLRIWRCHGLWCRLQMQLGSRVTVAVVWAGSWSSSLLAWGLPYAAPVALQSKNKQTNKQINNKTNQNNQYAKTGDLGLAHFASFLKKFLALLLFWHPHLKTFQYCNKNFSLLSKVQ